MNSKRVNYAKQLREQMSIWTGPDSRMPASNLAVTWDCWWLFACDPQSKEG